jgi:hypothetical protein
MAAGYTLRELMEYVGHSSLQATERYVRLLPPLLMAGLYVDTSALGRVPLVEPDAALIRASLASYQEQWSSELVTVEHLLARFAADAFSGAEPYPRDALTAAARATRRSRHGTCGGVSSATGLVPTFGGPCFSGSNHSAGVNASAVRSTRLNRVRAEAMHPLS